MTKEAEMELRQRRWVKNKIQTIHTSAHQAHQSTCQSDWYPISAEYQPEDMEMQDALRGYSSKDTTTRETKNGKIIHKSCYRKPL